MSYLGLYRGKIMSTLYLWFGKELICHADEGQLFHSGDETTMMKEGRSYG